VRAVADLQSLIESLHDVRSELDVREYLIDDSVRAEIPGAQPDIPEQLFVRESEEGPEIALYLAEEITSALHEDDPMERLHTGNLEAFCIGLEGVSHFVMLVHRAQHGHQVSALELELQAEVDKFVSAWLLLGEQGVDMRASANALARQIFDAYTIHDSVPNDEIDRYHAATRAARRYCRGLSRRCPGDPKMIRRDVRKYYRQGLSEKMRAA